MARQRSDTVLRAARRTVQALKLELAQFEQATVPTRLVESREEGEALGKALLAYTRDGERGLERFRFQERAMWRHVKAVLGRARAQDGDAGAEEEE